MTGKTHEKLGFLTPLFLGTMFYVHNELSVDILSLLSFVTFSVIGSTLPDIDQTQSKSGKRMPITSHLIKLINKIAKKLKLKRVNRATGHRGMTHSLLLWFILYSFAFILMQKMFFISPVIGAIQGLFIGVATHLFLDMLTPAGIPFFAPISYTHISLMKIKTGSNGEKFLKNILCIVLMFFIIFFTMQILFPQINTLGQVFEIIRTFFLTVIENIKSIFQAK